MTVTIKQTFNGDVVRSYKIEVTSLREIYKKLQHLRSAGAGWYAQCTTPLPEQWVRSAGGFVTAYGEAAMQIGQRYVVIGAVSFGEDLAREVK